MLSFFQKIFSRPPASSSAEEHLALLNRIRELEMEVESLEQSIHRLRADNQRSQISVKEQFNAEMNAHLEHIMQQAASPVSQILTQSWLNDGKKTSIQAADVLTVSRRLIRVLENAGMQILHTPGEIAAFDANQHLPLNAGTTLQNGQTVLVRFAGIAWQGRILLKAAVEPINPEGA